MAPTRLAVSSVPACGTSCPLADVLLPPDVLPPACRREQVDRVALGRRFFHHHDGVGSVRHGAPVASLQRPAATACTGICPV
jgi:hypothetical protein